MKHAITACATILVCLSAHAAGAPGDAHAIPVAAHTRSGPCKADIEKLCANVTPGRGAILACLKRQQDQVSEACRETLMKVRHRKAPAPAEANNAAR